PLFDALRASPSATDVIYADLEGRDLRGRCSRYGGVRIESDAQSSVYFLAFPLARWIGYFSAFKASFRRTAPIRSVLSLSEQRTRYKKTSASSRATSSRASGGSV